LELNLNQSKQSDNLKMSFITGLIGGISRSMDMLSGAIDIIVVQQPVPYSFPVLFSRTKLSSAHLSTSNLVHLSL
jgi:hypothetical protein